MNFISEPRRAAAIGGALMVMLCAGFSAWGQPQRPQTQRQQPPQRNLNNKVDLASARPMLAMRMGELDGEIASRLLRRPGTLSDQLPRLEMEIDWRFLTRWMLQQAHDAEPGSELQVAAALRSELLEHATAASEALLAAQKTPLTENQQAALAALRKLTFDVKESNEVKALDEISRRAAFVLGALANVQMKGLPVLRPRPVRARPAGGQTDYDQLLANHANNLARLNVSVPLRQQLNALIDAARAAAATDKGEEIKDVFAMLDAAVDLASALHHRVGITPENRMTVEMQLAESLALFLDPRLRDVGQQRLDQLQQYRQAVTRIGRLNLSPEQMNRLAPLFAWAQQNPDVAGRTMTAAERYVAARSQLDARGKRNNALTGLQRTQEELLKHANQASAGFEAAALDVARGGGRTVNDLETAAEELTQAVQLVEIVDQMPATIDSLSVLRPKGLVNLERRVVQAAASAVLLNSPSKGENLRFLQNLDRLAELTGELSQLKTSSLSPLIDVRYGVGRMGAIESHWKALAGDLVSGAALQGQIDQTRLTRLEEMKRVHDVLREAAAVESALRDAEVLNRWVDWRMTTEQLQGALAGYFEAVGNVIVGTLASAEGVLETWNKSAMAYRGLAGLVSRAGEFREACAAFPTGITWIAAALQTPLDNAPFAAERYVSFTLDLWEQQRAAGDGGSTELLDAVLRGAMTR